MDTISIRSDANPKCLSIEQCKELAKRGKYVNFSAKVLEIATRDLSGTAFKIWQLLSAETVFNENWTVQLSYNYIASYVKRCVMQVSRLVKELVTKGYIEKVFRAGKLSVFAVRLPLSIQNEFKKIKPRRRACPANKNVRGQTNHSFYFNNITNNSAAKQPNPNITQPTASSIVVDLEKLEREYERLDAEFTESCRRREPQEKRKPLSERLSKLYVEISRLKKPAKVAKDYLNSPGARLISDFDKARLARAGVPEPIKQEIAFAVRRNDLGRGSIPRGISAALKLYREDRWQTPVGMRQ